MFKKYSRFTSLLLCLAIVCPFLFTQPQRAQEPTPTRPPIDKTELQQALIDLTNPWTVMCVAAHPDDEDGTTLTVLRRKYGVHTVSLFSTYGEGGQNAVGPELYEELGVIRARETMAAARIQGSEPYFLGLKDFGFSKSADEAFRVWGHDEALRRMVLQIRELRPDVVITNHDTTSGHGHHQATGRLILEAFDAAADPKRFPEQLTQVSTWQIQRLFLRRGFGNPPSSNEAAPAEKIVSVDPNELDPIRGTIYAAQALAALQQHATQGPWPKSIEERLKAQGNKTGKLPLIRYQLVREAANIAPLSEHPTTFLDGLKLPETEAANLAAPLIDGRPLTEFVDQPDRVLDALIDWRAARATADPPATDLHRASMFDARFNHALAVTSGVSLSLNSGDEVLVPGVKTTFSVNLANSGTRTIQIKKVTFDGWIKQVPLRMAEQLLPDTEANTNVESATPDSATLTVAQQEHLYDGLLLGKAVKVEALLNLEGAQFLLSKTVNLSVAPAVEIQSISPLPCVRTEATLRSCEAFDLTLTNHLADQFRGLMSLNISISGSRVFDNGRELALAPHETHKLTTQEDPSRVLQGTTRSLMRSGQALISIYRLGTNKLITQKKVLVVFSNARVVPELHVGYLPSFDETLKQSLSALGVEAKELQVSDVQSGDLSGFDTIIIDNRGYEAHPELIEANDRLLKFASDGGTLIVFYHKSNEWNPDPRRNRPQLAPYPIILGDERVTDENAPVEFTRHPLLNSPNMITAADFKDWIQERGLYYPKEWDSHYSAPFSTNDPGEQPLRGGLLLAPYGHGTYIYTSMVWYRQLRAGVPGGYRMFANMISYGHKAQQQHRKSTQAASPK